jgi:hypothetical protein
VRWSLRTNSTPSFSMPTLHWIKDDPDGPIAGAFRAFRIGGRLVGELGGHACVGAITVALEP